MGDVGLDGDFEPCVAGDVECVALRVGDPVSCAVQTILDGAVCHFHTFRSLGIEAIGAGEDDAECFFATIGEEEGVADDTAVVVDVGFAYGGNIRKGFGDAVGHRLFPSMWCVGGEL